MKILSKQFFLLFLMLAVSLTTFADDHVRGDCNNDGNVNISDVTSLIDYLLTGNWPGDHEYVDLGLPSGTLWATCNVGANSPEEFGDYFAWGETEPKDYYDWSTYKWCNGRDGDLTKYCDCYYGYSSFIDYKTELDPEDDAAYVNWGSSWRMPTKKQLQELYDNCTSTWTTKNGVNGRLVTGPNGNTIFLPAAGGRYKGFLNNAGTYGYFWSLKLSDCPSSVCVLAFDSGGWYDQNVADRDHGFTVRAVRISKK